MAENPIWDLKKKTFALKLDAFDKEPLYLKLITLSNRLYQITGATLLSHTITQHRN